MENLIALPLEVAQNDEDAECALVERAKTSSAAFGVLYERYVMYVYHYLRTRVDTATPFSSTAPTEAGVTT